MPLITFKLLAIAVLLSFSTIALSHNKVVVVPLFGDDAETLQNIVTVAKDHGDFNNPLNALNSITDASANNPYLIVIAPGVYNLTQQLVMREFVDIAGSGRSLTRLVGSVSAATLSNDAALIVGAPNVSLRDLTIENNNGINLNSVGISTLGPDPSTPRFSNIVVRLTGGQTQVGISSGQAVFPVLEDVGIEILDGSGDQTGISSGLFGGFTATRCNILISGGDGVQVGVRNLTNARALMHDSTISVRQGAAGQGGVSLNDSSTLELNDSRIFLNLSGATQIGVDVSGNSRAIISNSTIRVFDNDEISAAISTSSNSTAIVRGSQISGRSLSLVSNLPNQNFRDYISDSILNRAPSGNPICDFVFLENGTGLDTDCDAI